MLIKARKELSKSRKGHVYIQWMVAIVVNSTLLTYGLQSGWISPMTKVLQSHMSPTGAPLSDSSISWIASTFCISAVFGVPFYTYLTDKYGRKVTIISIAVPQAISWVIKIISTSSLTLIIARVCCGLAAGGCFNIVPMYTKEISQDNIRGLLGSIIMLFQNIGLLSMYAMGAYLDYYTVLWIVLGIPIITALLMLKAPESPAFLVKMGKIDEAAKTIAFLRGLDMSDKIVQNEINFMRNEDLKYKSLPNVTFLSILKDKLKRRCFFLCISLISAQSCNGNFAIITYASKILASSGVTLSPELQSLSFPAVMIIGSFVSMVCVDNFGRRPVFITAEVLSVSAMVSLATSILLQEQGSSVPSWLPTVSIVLSLFAYAGGILPIPYIVMSEVFNFQIRAKVMGFIVTYAWFIAFTQLASFGPISSALGLYTTFYCFAGINLFGLFVGLVFLPETKGKSVEQIQEELRKKF